MAQLDALQLSENIRKRLTDFCVDDSFVNDPKLADICHKLWSSTPQNGGLLSDLWIEGNFPAEQSDWTLAKLVDAGRFDAQLRDQLDKTGAVPSERPLYTHQYEAMCCAEDLKKQAEKPAVVVTAGTGTGKTEAFLLPILNALYASPTKQDGVKCIILYPMNALVNDQVGRLYSWLQGQTHVRLFHFTSETPENKKFADRDGIPNWDACRVRTRQEARGLENPKTGRKQSPPNLGQVPDILVTNYSMLEYMLCRPQDSVFFGSGLRAVVLDEAHLYTGTLAAEIALLLRRLAIRCGVSSSDILQMATSATLGSDNLNDLKGFAATIFSKSIGQLQVIEGRSTRVDLDIPAPPKRNSTPEDLIQQGWLDRPLMTYGEDMQPILAEEPDMCHRLRQQLPVLVNSALVDSVKERNVPARLLKETLGAAPLIHLLEKELSEKRHLPLRELAEILWGGHTEDEVRATVVLLQLAATARALPHQYPLVPHRIHLVARSNDGLSVCVNPDCFGDQHLKLSSLGRVLSGFHEGCSSCGGAVLSLFRCRNCGEWLLAGMRDDQYLKPVIPDAEEMSSYFHLKASSNGRKYVIDPITAELKGTADKAVSLYEVSECPRCGEGQQAFVSFAGRSRLILSILTETVLSEMPHFPTLLKKFLPARGRRLLVFSDSRQEAARLGPRLTVQHELQVIRAAILKQIVDEPLGGEETVAGIEKMIKEQEKELVKPDLAPGLRHVIEKTLQIWRLQAQSAAAGGSIDDWCKKLAREPILSELLDRETASLHLSEKDGEIWGQRAWEKNHGQVKRHAKLYLAYEFARSSRGDNLLENLGLVEVTYPGIDELTAPNTILGVLPHEQARTQLSQIWEDFLKSLCDTLRSNGVIALEDSDAVKDSPDIPYIGYWCAEQASDNRLVSFVGQSLRQRRLWFATQVLRACGVSDGIEDLANRMLKTAFGQLMAAAHPAGQKPLDGQLPWLQCHIRQSGTGPPQDAIQLVFDHLGLQRPVKLYRCERTGHLWYRSILGCAPEFGCNRTLRSISDNALNKDARVGRQRREYRNSEVFQMGLWAEEHSAQLSPHENRRLQDLFKYGIRNILSATTTLELGIDIGGLNAVLMSNVPPGKANYLQRAGRAGRRSDGSSAVITYARPQPYDREVFNRVGDYLERPLRKPLVFLDRNRVVKRHFHSFLLGEFFRAIYPEDQHVGAMNAFGNMGNFCGVPKVAYWKKGDPKPSVQTDAVVVSEGMLDFPWWNPNLEVPGLEAQFLSYMNWVRDKGQELLGNTIEALLGETRLLKELEDWHSFLQHSIDHFREAIHSWREEYENLLSSWRTTEEEQQAQANAIRYQLHALYAITVIEGLADRQFLPHYGFPIGVQKLRVIAPDQEHRGKVREEDQYRLERSSLLALREYVPGSQLLVGGKLVSSRGLLKHWTDGDISFGLRGQCCECVQGHFYYWISKMEHICPICGAKPVIPPMSMLFPKHGFSSAAWDPPKFGTHVERIGSAETATMTFLQDRDEEITPIENLGDIPGLVCHYQEDGEIMVYNKGENNQGFAICLKCGFAESETDYGDGIQNLSSDFVNHAPLHSSNPYTRCWPNGKPHIIRNQVLSAHEITDVLMVDFVGCLDFYARDRALITTLGYALQRAGVQVLELDTREIGVMTVPAGEHGSGWGVVLYDNVPGGAGHVRELLGLGRLWLKEGLHVLYVNPEHHDRCEAACLDCLLGIDAQIAVSRGLLKRKQAHRVLDLLLQGSPLPQPDNTNKQEIRSPENTGSQTPQTDRKGLLQKAQKRLKRRG